MINENAAIYIGIVTTCILETTPSANVIARKLGPGLADGYEIIGTGKAKTGESVQATHYFTVDQVRSVSAADLQQAARLAGDSVGLQLRDRVG